MEGIVKVGKVPGRVVEVAVAFGTTTVVQALELAGFKQETGYSVRMNGRAVTNLNEAIAGETSITMVRDVRGNFDEPMTVRVGQVPGRIQEVVISANGTVAMALEAAGLNAQTGFSIRVDGNPIRNTEDKLTDGAAVTLVRDVRGNK